MNSQKTAYIAGVGMITSIGINAKMTAASVKSGISGYSISHYQTDDNESITTASVPNEFFKDMQVYIEEGDVHSSQYDHIIKMAIMALKETIKGKNITKNIPLILTLPEPSDTAHHIKPEVLMYNLANQDDLPLEQSSIRAIHTGRAAGMQALELAFRYLYDTDEEFVLIGGSDSCLSYPFLNSIKSDRLKTAISMDSYVPGEGAGFILLTRDPALALNKNNKVIAVHEPGIAEEQGHLYSEEPYRGEGLDLAFKKALNDKVDPKVSKIFSSMNGENHWAKEYGVAMIRNEKFFSEKVETEHPADCYGDLGSATSMVLIGLATLTLLNDSSSQSHLVYSSSDRAVRGAVKLDKQSIQTQ